MYCTSSSVVENSPTKRTRVHPVWHRGAVLPRRTKRMLMCQRRSTCSDREDFFWSKVHGTSNIGKTRGLFSSLSSFNQRNGWFYHSNFRCSTNQNGLIVTPYGPIPMDDPMQIPWGFHQDGIAWIPRIVVAKPITLTLLCPTEMWLIPSINE